MSGKILELDWAKVREELSPRFLVQDFLAALAVTGAAVPLSLALALASGVDAVSGILSAVVAGVVCGVFGGSKHIISGSANSMPLLAAAIVQQFGMSGLAIAVISCGLLQIIASALNVGRFIRFTPVPVVYGFTAGVGGLLFINQLPRALGIPLPDRAHTWGVIRHLASTVPESEIETGFIVIVTLAIVFLFPKVSKRLPAVLVALLTSSVLCSVLGFHFPTLGSISLAPPTWTFSPIPQGHFGDFFELVLVSFGLMSVESLLTLREVENLTHEAAEPDRELLGQGLANIVAGALGCLPVTALIARSALNIQAGAKTRWASILSAGLLAGSVFLLSPWIGKVPIPVLTGLVLGVGLRMIRPTEFFRLWKISKSEATVTLITFFTILFVGLISGIQAGLAAALIIIAFRLGNSRAKVDVFEFSGLSHLSINGSLTFMSAATIDGVKSKIAENEIKTGLVVDFAKVGAVDVSGVTQLLHVLEPLLKTGKVAFVGLNAEQRRVLLKIKGSVDLTQFIADTEYDVFLKLKVSGGEDPGLQRIRYGVERFKYLKGSEYAALFQNLAKAQNPHTLFITCCDSRIDPNLITSTNPGELFVLRNIGNIIPPSGSDSVPAEGAAVEFAISVLGVSEVVVCGHSECGAIKGFISGDNQKAHDPKRVPHMIQWLEQLEEMRPMLSPNPSVREVVELNAVRQIKNLKTYPIVQEKLGQNQIRLHAWYYDIGASEVTEWNEEMGQFGAEVK